MCVCIYLHDTKQLQLLIHTTSVLSLWGAFTKYVIYALGLCLDAGIPQSLPASSACAVLAKPPQCQGQISAK